MAEGSELSSLHTALRARMEYLRDLGIFDLYRREWAAAAPGLELQTGVVPQARGGGGLPERVLAGRGLDGDAAEPACADDLEESDISPRRTALQPVAFTPGARVAPAARARVLAALREEIGDCTRCPLGFAGRHSIVFGDGDANARLLFVGEGPGADEDAQGVPFVGRAGQLLNNMITAMGMARDEVYIANIVKCRPPQNRVPEPVEAVTCSQFLFRQIDVIRPAVIVALGSTAATYLLGGKSALGGLRGRVHEAAVAPYARLIVTYHPAYLLRDPRQKKEAWADLQMAMAELKKAT